MPYAFKWQYSIITAIMNKQHSSLIITIVVLVVLAGAYVSSEYKKDIEISFVPSDASDPRNIDLAPKADTADAAIASDTSSADNTTAFTSETDPASAGSTVGYFGNGAFVMSVPNWVTLHWQIEMGVASSGSMTLIPKDNSAPRDFSDIVISVGPATETQNAAWYYNNNRNIPVPQGVSMVSEVINNEAGNMRIYHITKIQGQMFYETYYFDAENKTASLTFYANKDKYLEYSLKIKEFVTGIGTGKEQG